MPDVFLSYNREDRDRARLVSDTLGAEGFVVWWDAALKAGETYDEVTEKNLREAGAVVVLWSKRSANSKWVRAEATVGERSSTLVPALIEECDRPVRFELVQTADLTRWSGDRNDPNWRGFVQDVKDAIARRATKGAPKEAGPAARTSDAVTIETSFWNSIKDGGDRSDFEAYLARYPHGHFVDLAKNRVAAIDRKRQQAAARPAPAPQPAQRAAAAPAPAPAPQKRGGLASPLIYVGIAALLTAGAVGAFLYMQRQGDSGTEVAAATPSEPAVVEAPAPPPTDVVAENTSEPADANDDVVATEDTAADIPAEPAGGEPVILAAVEAAEAAPVAPSGPTSFQDCEFCPLMIDVPAGAFTMGSPKDEPGRNAYEGPQREVTLKPFAIGVYEVTEAEWAACVEAGACTKKGDGEDGKMPALAISWREATAYARWLSKHTGRSYRLPTEAEWEYAARAGTTGAYLWGDRFDRSKAVTGAPQPVGTLEANAFGLYDVTGNAREWVEDCYVNNFVSAPTDGSAVKDGDCSLRVIRGGAWSNSPADLRIANRSRIASGEAPRYMGFRLVAEAK